MQHNLFQVTLQTKTHYMIRSIRLSSELRMLFNIIHEDNECFPILSPWIKSWRLYNGYSTTGRQPPS